MCCNVCPAVVLVNQLLVAKVLLAADDPRHIQRAATGNDDVSRKAGEVVGRRRTANVVIKPLGTVAAGNDNRPQCLPDGLQQGQAQVLDIGEDRGAGLHFDGVAKPFSGLASGEFVEEEIGGKRNS